MTDLPISNGKLLTKALTYRNYSTPLEWEPIELAIEPETIVKPNEILVKTKAASINPVDCILQKLSYTYIGSRTKVLGGDFSGIIIKAGSESGFNDGDEVYGDILSPMSARGSFSEYLLIDPKKSICEKKPTGMTFEQAASLPIVFYTAFGALKVHKDSLEGANVLVLGGGTSVGRYAIQIAKKYMKAAKVVATCSSKSKEDDLKYGADITVDYTGSETSKVNAVLEFVKNNGKFDIIVDCVRDEVFLDYLDPILKPTKEGGVYLQIAGSSVMNYETAHFSSFFKSFRYMKTYLKGLLGLSPHTFVSFFLKPSSGAGASVNELWNKKELDIPIDTVCDGFTEFQAAFDKVASCKAKGKVVCTF